MAVNDIDLAIAIARAKQSAPVSGLPNLDPNLSPVKPVETEGFMPQLNAGIADSLGAPVDVVNSALGLIGLDSETPFLGSDSISNMERAVGIDVAEGPPMTRSEVMARGAGAAAGAIPALLTGSGAVSTASKTGTSGRVARSVSAPFMATPVRAMTAEALGGAGAALGSDIANEKGYGLLGQVLAPLVGGVSLGSLPTAAPAALKTAARYTPGVSTAARLTTKGLAASVAPFTKAGSTAIAQNRVRSLSSDPAGQAEALLPPTGTPAERAAIESMTPAQRTGDIRLMALERAILDSDASLSDQFRQRTSETTNLLRKAFTGKAGDVRDTVNFLRGRRDYYLGLLEQRTNQALDIAAQRVDSLGPDVDPMAASRIVKSELQKARDAARAMESQLWNRIPKDEAIQTTNLEATWRQIMEETPEALQGRIPKVARDLLDRQGGITGNVGEVHGLYSELGSLIRSDAARAGKGQNIRFAKMLQEAALKDLGAVDPTTPTGKLINEARAFSLDLNQTFNQGTVGRVLGSSIDGGSAIPEELLLDRAIGSGRIGAVAIDDIRRAAGPQASLAIDDYILSKFNDFAVRDGVVDLRRADTFFRQNKELLERMPGTAIKLVGARDAAYRASTSAKTTAARTARATSPKENAVAAFTEAPKGRQIDTIFANDNPLLAAKAVYTQAARDETGAAVAGLKNSLSEYLLKQARTGVIDEAGDPIPSGRRLQALMRDNDVARVMNKIYTTKERARMNNIANMMVNVERSVGQLPNVGDRAITDLPSRAISFVLGTLAARQGAKLGAGTSGASLRTSSMAVNRMNALLGNLTEGRASRLLEDAIQDPDLFRALMVDLGKSSDESIGFAEKYIADWLIGTAASESFAEERAQ